MKTNKINAVDMVRKIRDQQYEHTKSMDIVEKQSYYRQRAQSLMAKLKNLIQEWRQRVVTP